MTFQKHYSLIFLADIPAFYKLNLYNRIDAALKERGERMMVIFMRQRGGIGRNADFFQGRYEFEHTFLPEGSKASRIWLLGH